MLVDDFQNETVEQFHGILAEFSLKHQLDRRAVLCLLQSSLLAYCHEFKIPLWQVVASIARAYHEMIEYLAKNPEVSGGGQAS